MFRQAQQQSRQAQQAPLPVLLSLSKYLFGEILLLNQDRLNNSFIAKFPTRNETSSPIALSFNKLPIGEAREMA